MLRSTRAALAVGLGCIGVAALVGRSVGQSVPTQDARVARAGSTAATGAPAAVALPALAVGTLDVESVFKNYDKVKVAGETLNAEVQVRYKELTDLANVGKTEQEKLNRFTPGTADYKAIENKMVQLKAQIEAGRENAQREFTQKETDTMTAIYDEIAGMAQAVAKQRGMTCVVKYNEGKIPTSEPNSAMAAMSKTIIWADPRFDITNVVIGYLNQAYKVKGGAAPRNAAPAAGAGAGAGAAPAARPAAAPAPR